MDEAVPETARCHPAESLKMDKIQYRAIRKKFYPEDPAGFLVEMGYRGNRNTIRVRARRFENGDLPIPENVARFAWLLDQWRLMSAQLGGDLNDLPEWPSEES